jgi:hypothetical protein
MPDFAQYGKRGRKAQSDEEDDTGKRNFCVLLFLGKDEKG